MPEKILCIHNNNAAKLIAKFVDTKKIKNYVYRRKVMLIFSNVKYIYCLNTLSIKILSQVHRNSSNSLSTSLEKKPFEQHSN